MFFDEVRKVQFGKRSATPASREEIISAQRRDKERRDLEKRKVSAAISVQKKFRAFLIRRKVAKTLVDIADAVDDRKFVILSLVQKIFPQALGDRLEISDPATIGNPKALEILLKTRVRAGLGIPESRKFRPDQFPVVMDFLRNYRVSWTAVPAQDLENYMRAVPEICYDVFSQVPAVCRNFSDDFTTGLIDILISSATPPFNDVFLGNLRDLATFAVRHRLPAIEKFIWQHELLLEDFQGDISREFPALALSAWPAVAGDSRVMVGLVPLVPAYERKLSELFSGSVQAVAERLVTEISRNHFRNQLFEVFTSLLSLNLRMLYKRELTDRKSAPLALDRLLFWGLVANQIAATSLAKNIAVPESVFALARASYDRRTTLGADDTQWYVGGNFPESNTQELADFLTGEHETKNVTGNFLKRLPHAVPFERRVRIFHGLIDEDSYRGGFVRRSATVRRAELFEDGLNIFTTHQGIKDNLRIAFINEVGAEEAGVDGGGLLKEFMHLWMQSAVAADRGLFAEQKNRKVVPRAFVNEPKAYAAVGRAVGKALYERVLAETRFSEIFMNRVFGRPFSVDELEELDEELYRNLFRLKETRNVQTWGVSFVASGPAGSEVPLIPNGANELVTDANKLQYIHLLARHKLVTEISRAASDFATGLDSIVPLAYLRFFSSTELELLISGKEREGFDIEDLRLNCVFSGQFTETSETVQLFWQLVQNDMTNNDRVALLTFVTSSPRAPLLGFRVLNPKFAIQGVSDTSRLPTASTCVNLLKLPDYRDYQTLKDKLLLAIHSKSGFDFS